MFIQSEATPNPATLKFLPGREVAGARPAEFRSLAAAQNAPLAAALLSLNGVESVFLGADFVSVTQESEDWSRVKPDILGAIMEHFMAGRPMFSDEGSNDASVGGEEFFAPEDREVVEQIKELLDTRVRPAVANDGGDIKFRGFRDGVAYLVMHGACSGCPSSTATLKHGVQNLLRHFVPEVQSVEQIEA